MILLSLWNLWLMTISEVLQLVIFVSSRHVLFFFLSMHLIALRLFKPQLLKCQFENGKNNFLVPSYLLQVPLKFTYVVSQ